MWMTGPGAQKRLCAFVLHTSGRQATNRSAGPLPGPSTGFRSGQGRGGSQVLSGAARPPVGLVSLADPPTATAQTTAGESGSRGPVAWVSAPPAHFHPPSLYPRTPPPVWGGNLCSFVHVSDARYQDVPSPDLLFKTTAPSSLSQVPESRRRARTFGRVGLGWVSPRGSAQGSVVDVDDDSGWHGGGSNYETRKRGGDGGKGRCLERETRDGGSRRSRPGRFCLEDLNSGWSGLGGALFRSRFRPACLGRRRLPDARDRSVRSLPLESDRPPPGPDLLGARSIPDSFKVLKVSSQQKKTHTSSSLPLDLGASWGLFAVVLTWLLFRRRGSGSRPRVTRPRGDRPARDTRFALPFRSSLGRRVLVVKGIVHRRLSNIQLITSKSELSVLGHITRDRVQFSILSLSYPFDTLCLFCVREREREVYRLKA